jgi:ABC-type glycerol-3-phosphate transport system substrate-binding protein
MRKIALIGAAALALAACGQTHIAKPSDSYLHCAPEPDVPGDAVTGVVTDEQDAQYKRDLRGSGQDCRSKVDYLHDWFAKLPS